MKLLVGLAFLATLTFGQECAKEGFVAGEDCGCYRTTKRLVFADAEAACEDLSGNWVFGEDRSLLENGLAAIGKGNVWTDAVQRDGSYFFGEFSGVDREVLRSDGRPIRVKEGRDRVIYRMKKSDYKSKSGEKKSKALCVGGTVPDCGTVSCTVPGRPTCTDCIVDSVGVYTASQADCQARCAGNADCVTFSFNEMNGCFLYDVGIDQVDSSQTEVVTGPKECPPAAA